jgi:hypothetical protein
MTKATSLIHAKPERPKPPRRPPTGDPAGDAAAAAPTTATREPPAAG